MARRPGSLARLTMASIRLLRKGGNGVREIAPVELQRHAGDFPMAGDGVLAARDFGCAATWPMSVAASERIAARRRARRLPKPERGHVRHVQRHVLADVAQRVGALVTEGRGIGRTADAEAIEDQEKGAGHRTLLFQAPMRAWIVADFPGVSPTE